MMMKTEKKKKLTNFYHLNCLNYAAGTILGHFMGSRCINVDILIANKDIRGLPIPAQIRNFAKGHVERKKRVLF